MASLPVISGREAAKAFEKVGFIFHRQKGSHMILSRQRAASLSTWSYKTWPRNPAGFDPWRRYELLYPGQNKQKLDIRENPSTIFSQTILTEGRDDWRPKRAGPGMSP